MKKGICCAGNIVVDVSYPIEAWPRQGELTHILDGIAVSTGGAVCNTVTALARLDAALPLQASGFAGHDSEGDFVMAELGKYKNIDLSLIRRSGRTAFTAVMNNLATKERTFFTHAGATREYDASCIDWDVLHADILHVGYILLLPALDAPDACYGTKLAALLHEAQCRGIRTSVDVVTEAGARFARIVAPALRYTDYCIINELEASQTTSIPLRAADGRLLRENLRPALARLREMGVSTWAVIHCPELGAGIDARGDYYECPSLRLPEGYIKGTVGAGDAFCAGVLYAAESGQGLYEALKLGACTAASSLGDVTATGGIKELSAVYKLWELYSESH